MVVTGKGHPDLATRELLAALSDMGTPMFALVDLDPHGVEIMATVPPVSEAMAHGGPALCVEGLRWLGEDFRGVDGVIRAGGKGLKGLEGMDLQEAVSFLGKWWIEDFPSWRAILQKILF